MDGKNRQTMKDKVFAALFNNREYLAEIFNTLYPDEGPITQEELTTITMEKYLSAEHYDAGFLVRDSRMILLETQNELSRNYAGRILVSMYPLLDNYLRAHNKSIYSRKRLSIPTPSFYVIYTGHEDVPSAFCLSELFRDASDGDSCQEDQENRGRVEIRVIVFCGTGDGGILDQYIRFCQIADEMSEKYGETRQADEETVKQCRAEGILLDILSSLNGN